MKSLTIRKQGDTAEWKASVLRRLADPKYALRSVRMAKGRHREYVTIRFLTNPVMPR